MPVTGRMVLTKIFQKLKEFGFREGDEVSTKDIAEAVKSVGYYDQRTITKYLNAVLESEYIRKETTYKELRRLRRMSYLEINKRARDEHWSIPKWQAYERFFFHGRKEENVPNLNWDLIEPEDIVTEKVVVSQKFFIDHFP